MDKSIKISDDDYKIIKLIADKEGRNYKNILSQAIKILARLKKINH